MFLVLSVAFAAVSIVLLGLCYIGARDPEKPGWAGDFLVGSLYVPGFIMLMLLSASCLYWFIRDYDSNPLTSLQAITAAAVAIGGFVAWRALNVRKKLTRFSQTGKGQLITIDFTDKTDQTIPPASGGKAA